MGADTDAGIRDHDIGSSEAPYEIIRSIPEPGRVGYVNLVRHDGAGKRCLRRALGGSG